MSSTTLDELVSAAHALARELHGARTPAEAVARFAAAFEGRGFQVVVLGFDQGRVWLRHASPGEQLGGLVRRLSEAGVLAALPDPLRQADVLGLSARHVPDLPATLERFLGARLSFEGWPRQAVVAPLRPCAPARGSVFLARDGLRPGHLDLLALLALQLGAALELTDQARSQGELVRQERMGAVVELAKVVAHEVRNPLGVIYNSIATLRRVLTLTDESAMLLTMAGEEAERLNRIVKDLLDFVAPFQLVKRPVEVPALVRRAVASVSREHRSSSFEVVVDLPDGLPSFPADADLLGQAVANLVRNALEAMPRGGTARVRASLEPRAEGSWLRLDFEDEGVGLRPEVERQLFQPFFTTKATGTGLGLAVVKRIVDGHLGEVSAASNPERGTTFSLWLPPERR
jgi:signal transduction histidine kinase